MPAPHEFGFIKKSCFIPVLFAFALMAEAQLQPKFGIFAGPQTTSAKYKITGLKQVTSYKYGFQAGAMMKAPFEANLSFSPAFFYSLKGYKVKFTRFAYPPDTAAIDNNTLIHTIELALLLQYDMGKGPGHFFIKAGPSLDFQLMGKEKFNLKRGGSVSRKMPYSFADYGHYTASLVFHLGYETNSGFMIFGQYTWGLTDINNSDFGPAINHRAFGISIGKYFK